MKSKKCLVVIDMQNGTFNPQYPCYDQDEIVRRINALIDFFRKTGRQIIFVQHNGTALSEFLPGTHDYRFLEDLKIEKNDVVIEKVSHDAFYNSELDNWLKAWQVTELVVTGASTDFCVEATIQSALTKDYNILVVRDAHTTADNPILRAEQIIGHYNWVWEHMTPTKGAITLKSCEEILM